MKYFLVLFILTFLVFTPFIYGQERIFANDTQNISSTINTSSGGGAEKTSPTNDYMFKSVKVGNIIILTDKAGKQIGTLRNIGGTVIFYDMENKVIGMIKGEGKGAVLLSPTGKQIGIATKLGNTYIIYNNNGTKTENVIQISK